MTEMLKNQFAGSRAEMSSDSSFQAITLATHSAKFNLIFRPTLNNTGCTSLINPGFIRSLLSAVCIMLLLALLFAGLVGGEDTRQTLPPVAETSYPDLRNAHDPKLQEAMDAALGSSHPEFWPGVKNKEFSFVVADVTNLKQPKVAWYNPNLMLYAASAVVARDNLVYIVVYIDNHPDAGRGAVDGIKIVDDVMSAHANRNR